ncbi:MAG: hypothetical protein HYX94_03990 [Chloroflexi bacterium]|nr:hypothetical protein [Chloroflexota bacterium]
MDLGLFYPESQQRLFTDREYHLGLLELTRESVLSGAPTHRAILGP